MIPPEASTPATACDADARCMRVACFQVQLEASRPQQGRRRAFACAHHLTDVIEALRTWARERDLADGHLTVLAIEPTAGERPAGGHGTAALREFAFTTIPLKTILPETILPETIPPETIPPETIPPETIPPQTIPPDFVQHRDSAG